MQLWGRKELGIVVAAWLLSACPRYDRQPPPHVAGDPSSESAGATFAASSRGGRADRSTRETHLEGTRGPTCISGVITTGPGIPVARARVVVERAEGDSMETSTDDAGRFSWCSPRMLEGPTVRTSVHVEKAAFAASERHLDIPVGTTTELLIGLNPTP